MLTLPLLTLDSAFVPWTLLAVTLTAVLVGWRMRRGEAGAGARHAEKLAEQRAANLARILSIGNTMNATLDLDRLLTGIAEAVRESLGFRRVLVRLLDEPEGVFRARAFAGLGEEDVAKLRESLIPLDEFRRLMKEKFRVSRSYFISHTAQFWDRDDRRLVIPDLGERGEGEWHPLDSLFVPLQTRDRRLIGYLSVDDPVDRQVPTRETIETLEIFSNHAVTAIENAQVYAELENTIGELRRATAELEKTNETKNAFMANVSHELRTPLTSILAYLDTLWLEVGPGLPGQQKHFLAVIRQEADRLTGLVDDLLSFSRIEAGPIEIHRETVRLAEVIHDALAVVRPEADQKPLHVVEDLETGVEVTVDRKQMMQLVLNLLRNAVKFTEAGGTVTVRLGSADGGARIEVEDTGIGIREEDLERVFERFYQIDSSSTRRYGGVGLGLAISRAIAEGHGGRVWAESCLGQGSRFVVFLPGQGESPAPDVQRTRRRVPDIIVQLVAEVMQSKTASLMLLDEEKNDLYVETSLGLDPAIARNARVRVGEAISGWVAKHGRPLLVSNIEEDERFCRRNRSGYESKSLISVPLRIGDRVMGVLNVTNRVTCTPFTEDDTELLGALANRLSDMLDRLADGEELTGILPATQMALQAIIDARRRRHPDRALRTHALLAGLCRRLGMTTAETEILRYVSDIHDVGMASVDRSVLTKPDRLSDREMGEVRAHPRAGVEILSPIEFLDHVKEVILHHHERYDGRGYPDGLAGEAIPRGARVLAVLDAFESMTSDRPHRSSRSEEETVEEIRQCAGTQFDPAVVEAFLDEYRAFTGAAEGCEAPLSADDSPSCEVTVHA